MLILKNKQELEEVKNKFKLAVKKSLEFDMDIITGCFDSQSDEYGPLIVIINDNEQDEMINRFKVLEDLEPEDSLLIYEDDKEAYYRKVYIITDSGFVVYIRKEK